MVHLDKQQKPSVLFDDRAWWLIETEYDVLLEAFLGAACVKKPKHYSVLGSALLELFRFFIKRYAIDPATTHVFLTLKGNTVTNTFIESRFKEYLLSMRARIDNSPEHAAFVVGTELFHMYVLLHSLTRVVRHIHKQIMGGKAGTRPHKLFYGYSEDLALVMLRYMYSHGEHA